MSDASTGLLALALAVISASAFSLIMKFSQEKQYSVLAVGGVNYIVAAIAAALLVPWEHVTSVSSGMCLLAAVSGIGYLVTYLLMAHALPRRGITVPTAAVQVAMVVPLVPSVLLWHEHVSAACRPRVSSLPWRRSSCSRLRTALAPPASHPGHTWLFP